MTTTLKDIQGIFSKKGYSLERDITNSRRFILSCPNGTQKKIKMGYTMDEFKNEIDKLGLEKYIQTYDVSDAVSKSRGSRSGKSFKMKNRKNGHVSQLESGEKIPAALRSRRKAQIKNGISQAVIAQEKPAEDSTVFFVDLSKKETNQTTVPVQPAHLDISNYNSAQTQEMASYYASKKINYKVGIPQSHEGYYFPDFTEAILNRVAIGRNCFLAGPSGVGKTKLVVALADLLDVKLVRINFNVGTTEQHMIGRWIVKDGETVFVHGIVPLAMKYGWWILFDEIDYAMPEHMAILQPVLEGESLMIPQNANEEVIPHENFRVFATGNTKGRGDESQSYCGTSNLNLAFLDRWSIFEMGYTKKEYQILTNVIKDEILAEQIMTYFELLRKALVDGSLINAVFSTRRIEQLAEALEFGEPLAMALEYEIFSRYDKHEVDLLKELAYDIWDKTHYMRGWKIGDPHLPKTNGNGAIKATA